MSSSPASDGPIQQKLETAQAVRQADDADVYEMQEGAVKRKWQGTEADRKEMSQLGRVQELRVSLKGILGDRHSWPRRIIHITDMSLEKLPVYLHGRLCVHIDRDMGSPSYDSCEHLDQRWHGGSYLGIPHCFHRLLFRLLIDC